MAVRIAMIAALARNGVIGRDNQMPWHLPEDLRYFKQVTLGKPVIMGRKTFESIGKPLPGRKNIVVSRNSAYRVEGVTVVPTLDAALDLAMDEARVSGGEEVMVMGGGEIYRQAMPRCDRLYLTEVDTEVEGDAVFPPVTWSQWQTFERRPLSCEGALRYRFAVYDRKCPKSRDD